MSKAAKDIIYKFNINNGYTSVYSIIPFFLWIIIKYFIIGLFGVEAINEAWEKEHPFLKVFLCLFYFIGVTIAYAIDLARVLILFVAGIMSLFYIPILDRILEHKYRFDVSLKNNEE